VVRLFQWWTFTALFCPKASALAVPISLVIQIAWTRCFPKKTFGVRPRREACVVQFIDPRTVGGLVLRHRTHQPCL